MKQVSLTKRMRSLYDCPADGTVGHLPNPITNTQLVKLMSTAKSCHRLIDLETIQTNCALFLIVSLSIRLQIPLLCAVLRIIVVIDCEFCLVNLCWFCGLINVVIIMKEVLLVGPIGPSEAASETDAYIEQGAKSAIDHEDNAEG